MNKSDLVAVVAEKLGATKRDAEASLNAVVEAITESLVKGEKIQLVGFGSFEVRKRAARKATNPRTKEEIKVPASKSPVFKAGKALKDAVNKAIASVGKEGAVIALGSLYFSAEIREAVANNSK